MITRLKVGRTLCLLVLCTFRLWGQGPPLPVPIPGGDVIQGFGLINQFLPGPGAGFDGLNADPQGINNSSGHVALGFTAGIATDGHGKMYNIGTDIRVYQGKYAGAVVSGGDGGSISAVARGTFIEI